MGIPHCCMERERDRERERERERERNCHKTLGVHDMGGIRMTDCYETFIPPQPASSAASTATAAAAVATDFLTATGFRFRPPTPL